MKNQNMQNSSSMYANQDMMELLKHGRTLHDRAVFELFLGLAERCRRLFNKIIAISANENAEAYHEDRGVPFSR